MDPNDALFAVKVITDGPSWLSTLWADVSPLIATTVGGVIAYRAAVGAEERKRTRDTYVLARSLAAELAAGQANMKMQLEIMSKLGQGALSDTQRYIRTLDTALPVARAAASAAGQFVVPVAETLARFLLLSQNLTQHQAIVVAMREEHVLTDGKLQERQQFISPIAHELVACTNELRTLIDKHYPQEP
jgi:hypothetical protein